MPANLNHYIRTLLLVSFLPALTISEAMAAAGGTPGANPGVGPPAGVINKNVCRADMVTTVMNATMDFGSFTVAGAGSFDLSPGGVRQLVTGGIDTINTPVTVFTVSINNVRAGCEIYDILLTLPATATLTGPGGTLTLSNFVASPVTTATTIAAPITYPYILNIGATITSTGPLTAGTYSAPAAAYTLSLTY